MNRDICVFQDWLFGLTMQQQSVLVLACRGPDGIAKFNPCKQIVARYRATVLKAAYLGRPMRVDEGDDTTFMTLIGFSDSGQWAAIVREFFDHVDSLPHHYYLHLAHGAQIAGYKHPEHIFRQRWREFYFRCCDDMHMHPETEADLDARLSDWGRRHWDLPQAAE
jgi:hypothetical protein